MYDNKESVLCFSLTCTSMLMCIFVSNRAFQDVEAEEPSGIAWSTLVVAIYFFLVHSLSTKSRCTLLLRGRFSL